MHAPCLCSPVQGFGNLVNAVVILVLLMIQGAYSYQVTAQQAEMTWRVQVGGDALFLPWPVEY
jgi:hypothetical protein